MGSNLPQEDVLQPLLPEAMATTHRDRRLLGAAMATLLVALLEEEATVVAAVDTAGTILDMVGWAGLSLEGTGGLGVGQVVAGMVAVGVEEEEVEEGVALLQYD